jgi:hypothetical protein
VEAQAGAELGCDRFAADEPNSRAKSRRVGVAGNPQALAPSLTHGLSGVVDESPCVTSSMPLWVDEQVIQLGLGDVSHGNRGEAKDRFHALEAGHRYARAALGEALAGEAEELGAGQKQRSVLGIR